MVCSAPCRKVEDGSIFCMADSGARVCSVADRCDTSRDELLGQDASLSLV